MDAKEESLKEELSVLQKRAESEPDFYTDKNATRRLPQLNRIIDLFDQKHRIEKDIRDSEELDSLLDTDEEKVQNQIQIEESKQLLKINAAMLADELTPKDPNDGKDAIIEIRAAAGGDESSLFGGELYRMYIRWCETHSCTTELISESSSEAGGFKEIIFAVHGEDAYRNLKFEAGVHRVQRVPVTESQGRIHTSTVTVAVMPEAEESDIEINPSDLKIDVFRSGGHGGQSVNTTDSAVRITHLPTGVVVTNQDEKSQIKNKLKAMSVLRSRLLQIKIDEETKQLSDDRKKLIGTGDRSEKIRTYNFPQDRITDHRIGYSRSNVPAALAGDIDDLIEKLHDYERQIISNE